MVSVVSIINQIFIVQYYRVNRQIRHFSSFIFSCVKKFFILDTFVVTKYYCVMPSVVSYAIVTIKSRTAEQNGINVFTVTNYGVSDNLLMRRRRRRRTKASGKGEREGERKTPGA